MDIAALSMVMSQSKAQTSAGIAIMKKAMPADKENATQMIEMMKNVTVDLTALKMPVTSDINLLNISSF